MTLGQFKYVLGEDGKTSFHEPDLVKWAGWIEGVGGIEQRRVGRDTVGRFLISTVFLGLDHNFGEGPPVLFETMIFELETEGPLADLFMARYCDWDEAKAGHDRVVEKVREMESRGASNGEVIAALDDIKNKEGDRP